MRLESYRNKDSYRVVLSTDENKTLIDEIDDQRSKIAWQLGSQAGLRRAEIDNLTYNDVVKRDTGDYVVRVYEDGAKRDKYRETPVPESLAVKINTIEETTKINGERSVVDHSMRTVHRHLNNACESIGDRNNDDAWKHISLHDGRRTWANALLDADVSPMQVMQWGGWDDWRTFRDHYLQDFSAEYQSKEIAKVDWI